MGVKGLGQLLNTTCMNSQSISTVSLESFRGKRLIVDAENYLFGYMYGKSESELYHRLTQQVATLRSFGIVPIYAFDGKKTNRLKKETVRKRSDKHKNKKVKHEEYVRYLECKYREDLSSGEESELIELSKELRSLTNLEMTEKDRLDKLYRSTIKITNSHKEKCRELLNLLGIQWHIAESESDLLCSKLCRDGTVDGVISEDYDMIPFGCSLIIRNLDVRSGRGTRFNLKSILNEMNLDRLQMIDMCILAGCDYSSTLRNRESISKHYRNIKNHGSIENIIENRTDIPDRFRYKDARAMFLTEPFNEPFTMTSEDIKVSPVNEKGLQIFLKENCNYGLRQMNRLMENMTSRERSSERSSQRSSQRSSERSSERSSDGSSMDIEWTKVQRRGTKNVTTRSRTKRYLCNRSSYYKSGESSMIKGPESSDWRADSMNLKIADSPMVF